MNCTDLIKNCGWDCAPVGENAFLAYAPFTLSNDGLLAKFYVLNENKDTFYLTDNYAAIEHAVDHGAIITKTRIAHASNILGLDFANITNDGEVVASGNMKNLNLSLWDALRATISITSKELDWQPKSHQTMFSNHIGKNLKRYIKGRVLTKPKVKGASGHLIEFPFGVKTNSGSLRLIQPIAVDKNRKLDWGLVYQSFGKLSDVKKASGDNGNSRLVVVEEGSLTNEFSRMATILSEVAKIVIFTDNQDFSYLAAA